MKEIVTHKQRGFTLMELMIALVIIAILMGLGTAMFGSALGRSDTTVEKNNIVNIMTSVRAVRVGTGYPDNLMRAVNRIEGFPTTMDIELSGADGVTVYNIWGGDVTLESGIIHGNRGFTIEYTNVPEAACYELATSVGTSRAIWTTINGSGETRGDDISGLESAANSNCSDADANTISWSMN